MKSLVVALALLVAGSVHAEPVVTAEFAPFTLGNTFGGFGGVGATTFRGQAFEATVTGPILSVQLYVIRVSDHDVPYVVEVFEADADGRPVGDAIVSDVFAASLAPISPASDKTVFEFGGEGEVVAGRSYTIIVGPESPAEENNSIIGGLGSAMATYPSNSLWGNGTSWGTSDISDFSFQVTVDGSTPIESVSWGEVKKAF